MDGIDVVALKTGLRAAARHAALDTLSVVDGLGGRARRALGRPRVHFIYLHAVPRPEEGRFRELLDVLSRQHTFVGHRRAVELLCTSEIDRPYASFSFDDGFASNRRAAEILSQYGTTGCFFVPSDFIGCRDAADGRQFFRSPDVDERALTWDEIGHLIEAGHEIGNHSRHHHNMSQLDLGQLQDEIAGGADILASHTGRHPEHFAWPLGRFSHFTDIAASMVFDSGHRTCASAERGAHVQPPHDGRYCLRRDHVMTSWPLRHTLHFLATSAAAGSPADNDWPDGWQVGP